MGFTSALVAVDHASGRAIVTGAHDSLVTHNHTADAPLHAIAAVCCQICQQHKVLVPARSEARLICEVERFEGTVQRRLGSGRVEELQLGALEEDLKTNIRRKEVTVVTQDKFFQGRGRVLPRSTSAGYKQPRLTGCRFARTGP